MNKPFIALCPEVSRSNALNLMDWLEDGDVTRYLSDSRHVSQHIANVIDRVHLPILTHLFNQGGRFFMAYDRNDVPVGFVRLVKTGTECEIVLVIGSRENWGRKLGASALYEGMKLAFFEMRVERLVAKIHAHNTRSIQAFVRSGFDLSSATSSLQTYVMTADRYLQRLRAGLLGDGSDIQITEVDQSRIKDVMLFESDGDVSDLEHELERATVVASQQVSPDVITMNTCALVQLDREKKQVNLVYPQDADPDAGKYSVFSDMGTAILGYKEGDAIDWRIAQHTYHIAIEKILYQPEAAGDFDR